MRLIKLHVDDFGTLHNYNLDLNSNLNSILENNGWGKTTLTIFIKSMLYGLPATKVKDLDKNERVKFSPWNNGTFGGTLEFSYDNKSYRIERTFASKANNDIYKVFDLSSNKEVTSKFIPSVGEVIFKIDADSFEKSMFVPQKDFDFDFGEDLKTRITDVFGKLDDSKNALDAKKSIDEKVKAISKGNSCKLANIRTQIKDLENTISLKQKDIDAIPSLEDKKHEIEKDINDKEVKLKEQEKKFALIEKAASRKAKKDQAVKDKAELLEKTAKLDKVKSLLNNEDVNKIDIEDLESLEINIARLNIKKEAILSTNLEENELNKLTSLFEQNPLDENKIEETKKEIAEYNSLNTQVVSNSIPATPTKKKPTPLMLGLMIGGAAIMIAGFVLIAFILIAGIICSFVGLITAIAGLGLYLVKNNSNNNNVVSYVPTSNPEREKLEEKLKVFFNKYQLYEMNFDQNIISLINKFDRYKELTKKHEEIVKNVEQFDSEIKEKTEALNKELSKYKLSSYTNKEKIKELNNIKVQIENLEKDIHDTKIKLDEFISTNDLNSEDETLDIDVDSLNKEKALLAEEITKNRLSLKTIDDDLNKLLESRETIEDDKISKTLLEEEQNNLKHRSKILDATSKFIGETDDLVKTKYVKPMTDKVNEYMNKLLKSKTINFNINTDFEFNGIEDTKQKEVKYYSRGYQQVFSICLRLALIDCLFTSEKPFLLLDDPFVDLDGDNLEQAKLALKEISKDTQVTYLTCHESRSIR